MSSDLVFLFEKVVLSQNGLLTTVAYKMGPDQPTVYALEVTQRHCSYEWH